MNECDHGVYQIYFVFYRVAAPQTERFDWGNIEKGSCFFPISKSWVLFFLMATIFSPSSYFPTLFLRQHRQSTCSLNTFPCRLFPQNRLNYFVCLIYFMECPHFSSVVKRTPFCQNWAITYNNVKASNLFICICIVLWTKVSDQLDTIQRVIYSIFLINRNHIWVDNSPFFSSQMTTTSIWIKFIFTPALVPAEDVS